MYNRIQLGRNGLLLVVSSLALGLVPLGRLQSHEAAPSREQIVHYHLARNAWASAARAGSPAARQALASCAESHLTHSLEGADFPEAHLALGLLYFNRSGNGERFDPDAYRAERHLRHAADQGAGAIRAEAQTYLGVLALHCKHWGMARQMFDSAAGADLRATHISVHSARLSEEYQTRAQRLAAVQKVGSALATYWMAVDPASPAPSPAAYQGALRALDSMGAPELNGTGAALWRFPEQEHARPRNLPVPVFPAARANWTLGAAATPPTGVEAVAADRFAAAGRIWAAGRLGMEPPRTAVAGLGTQDRRNLMMGLVRTLYTLESQRNYAGANAILTRLAEISEANTLVRQHRIWIALEGAPNLAQAAQLINGPGAQEDPLYAQQLVTLANKQAAAGQTDAARAAWGRVAAMTGQGPAAARNVARWNLAALALNQRTNDDDPEKWQRALQLSGPAPQGNTAPARARRYLQLYLQLRRAEALVARRQPAQVETALQAAAAIEQTLGGQPTEVRAFSEYLAARVVRENQQAQYQNGLLRRTQFGALSLAARASSAGSPDAAIRILEQAAALAGASPLGNQLRADIQYLRTRSAAPAGGPRAAFVNRWNQAVAATRAARVAPASDPAGFRSAWAGAASAWSGVAATPGGSSNEVAMARDYESRSRAASPGSSSSETRLAEAGAYPNHLRQAVAGPYRGRPIPAGDRMSILRATGPVTPDRDQWLNRLEQNAEAQNLMLDWFNRGGLAALGGGAGAAQVRRFGSGAEMLSFLRENTLPEAHVLPLGTTQWTVAPRDRRSARPRWLGSKLGYRTAAYCLTNGIPLVNVRCSNPVSPILESVSRSVTPGAAGPEAQELPAPAPEAVALPQYTASNPTWTWPQISLMSAVLGSADGPAFPICAPAVTLVATAAMPPQIPMPAGIAELPHCSPSRITIGRISTLGADAFAIREEEGTAESRRR